MAEALAERRGHPSGMAKAAIALLVVDDDCRIAEASLPGCRLLGLPRDEVVGQLLFDLLTPAGAQRLEGVWDAFHRAGGHVGPFELSDPTAASPIDISVTSSVLPGRHLVLLAPSEAGDGLDHGDGDGARAGRGPTAREREILAMLAAGDTDAQIARRLDLSPATVQTHVRNAKAKLGARTRAQAVAVALRDGMIQGA